MAHKFTVQIPLRGVSLQDARQMLGQPAFHEAVARKIPGGNLDLQHSGRAGRTYSMKREYNLDVDIHELAKKLLKGAFRLKREDEWDVDALTCRSRFGMNLPADLSCQTRLAEQGGAVVVHTDWEVNVRVPLVHGILARHAEGEIRRFSAAEVEVIQAEIDGGQLA